MVLNVGIARRFFMRDDQNVNTNNRPSHQPALIQFPGMGVGSILPQTEKTQAENHRFSNISHHSALATVDLDRNFGVVKIRSEFLLDLICSR